MIIQDAICLQGQLECEVTQCPTVSVVIPTYNRPNELERLLHCVSRQSYKGFECLVIDDGSSDDTQARYNEIWKHLDGRFFLHRKAKTDRKNGPGRSRNIGIRFSRGTFVAFCDDDDIWICDDHLEVAVEALKKHYADLFLTNMRSSTDGKIVIPDWFAVAPDLYRDKISDEKDLFVVTVGNMIKFLTHRNFHANMIVGEKRLFDEIGMYSEHQIFGEDYDIQLRLVDKARKLICRSTVVAELAVNPHSSISRDYDAMDRALFTISSCLRAEATVFDSRLRRVARANRAWCMLDLAGLMLLQGRGKETRELVVQSFFLNPTGRALRLFGRTFRASAQKTGR